MEGQALQIIEKDPAELIPYEKNPRYNDNAVPAVAASIKEFGFKVPIIIDKDNTIIAGHTRLKAAEQLGLDKVPCVIADDLTDAQIKAFRLADNKSGELAEWNDDFMFLELQELDALGVDMLQFGFEDFISPDEFGDTFELPDGEKPEICTMTFTLHAEQKSLIEYAMSLVEDDVQETFGNTNKGGNALYEVVRQWAEQRK